MQVRLVMTDSRAFWLALKHKVWGSSSERLWEVQPGDRLIFVLEDRVIGGVAQVRDEPFYEEVPIWRDHVRPYRVRLRFARAYLPENQPPLLGRIRELVRMAWSRNYPIAAIHLSPGEPNSGRALLRVLARYGNDLTHIRKQIDHLISTAAAQPSVSQPSPSRVEEETPTAPSHHQIQRIIRDLGLAGGLQVWVATNDANRVVEGVKLGYGCLHMLPEMGLNVSAHRLVEHIDVLWLESHHPRCAFEVELSTGIYPGILRMADLFMTVPHLNMPCYVVAPAARFSVFQDHVRRPMFQNAGLEQRCRFLPLEKLVALANEPFGSPVHFVESLAWRIH